MNLRKLVHGRIDLVFIDHWVAKYHLQRDPLLRDAQIEMLQPPIEVPALHIAWSRHSAAAAAARPACDEGIAELLQDGTIEELRKRHGLEAEQ